MSISTFSTSSGLSSSWGSGSGGLASSLGSAWSGTEEDDGIVRPKPRVVRRSSFVGSRSGSVVGSLMNGGIEHSRTPESLPEVEYASSESSESTIVPDDQWSALGDDVVDSSVGQNGEAVHGGVHGKSTVSPAASPPPRPLSSSSSTTLPSSASLNSSPSAKSSPSARTPSKNKQKGKPRDVSPSPSVSSSVSSSSSRSSHNNLSPPSQTRLKPSKQVRAHLNDLSGLQEPVGVA